MRAHEPSSVAIAVALGCASGLAACGSEGPAVPTAVVRTTPASICVNDDHQTIVVASALDSATGLTLVPVPPSADEPALELAWSFAGSPVDVAGDLTASEVSFTTAGDRPVHITLVTTNAEGGQATSLHTLPITMPLAAASCEAGPCPDGLTCVQQGKASLCALDQPCTFAADCPPCFVCQTGLDRCVPNEAAP